MMPARRIRHIGGAIAVVAWIIGLAHLSSAGWSLKALLVTICAAGAGALLLTWNAHTTERYRDVALALLNTIVLLVLVESVAELSLWSREWGVWRVLHSRVGRELSGEGMRDTDGQNDIPDPGARYEPYVIWKSVPFHSPDVNVDSSGNRVVPGSHCGPEAYRVLVLGGSTVRGVGVRDDETIPALLHGMLETRSRATCTLNLGQSGWVSTQRVVELIRRLQKGDRPDLVIDYDIANDVNFAWQQQTAGAHEDMACIAAKFNRVDSPPTLSLLLGWLSERSSTLALVKLFLPTTEHLQLCEHESLVKDYPRVDIPKLVREILDAYVGNYHVVEATAKEFGFRFAFFAGPNPVIDRRPVTADNDERRAQYVSEFSLNVGNAVNREPLFTELVKEVNIAVEQQRVQLDHLFNLGDILNDVDQPVYLDRYGHLNASANAIIARAIVDRLQISR